MSAVVGPPFWMNEQSGVLRRAVHAYFYGSMTEADVAAMRAYVRLWIEAPVWAADAAVAELRERVDGLTSYEALCSWLSDAVDIGIDPL